MYTTKQDLVKAEKRMHEYLRLCYKYNARGMKVQSELLYQAAVRIMHWLNECEA